MKKWNRVKAEAVKEKRSCVRSALTGKLKFITMNTRGRKVTVSKRVLVADKHFRVKENKSESMSGGTRPSIDQSWISINLITPSKTRSLGEKISGGMGLNKSSSFGFKSKGEKQGPIQLIKRIRLVDTEMLKESGVEGRQVCCIRFP